jgi:phage-related protein
MPNGYITWHGVNSNAVGVNAIEKYPDLDRPRRKFTRQSIPGATGDVIVMEDAWEDYEQEYELYGGTGANGSAPTTMASVAAWLYGGSGYQRLEDTYDTSTYREAYFAGPYDVENHFNRFGSCKVKFICKGKRWLKSGETAITVSTSGTTITNPTAFPSRPLVKVHCSGTGTSSFRIGGTLVKLTTLEEGMLVDCESMKVTNSAGTSNLNTYMTLGEFPQIPAGSSSVTFNNYITSLEITPRWYEV